MKHLMLMLAGLLLAGSVFAETDCPEHFAKGAAPEISRSAIKARTKELCFTSYAVMHSGITRTPLWSAEHLTQERIEAGANLPRPPANAFHAEPRLPAADRAELSDYKRSGYDRGHMSPNHDMPTPEAQRESFSLANIVPQSPWINQNLWAGIEQAVRSRVLQGGELYVITGPLFEGEELGQLNGRVLVPTSVFKAIYDPRRQTASAYVASNDVKARGWNYDTLTIAELERRIGIDLFPGMPEAVKRTPWQLPQPERHGHGH